MKNTLNYSDVILEPAFSSCHSRSNINTKMSLGDIEFNSVAIPSNMRCTIDFDRANDLSEKGYFYILHRFYDYEEILNWIRSNQHLRCISISIGVNGKDTELLHKIYQEKLRVDYITIDVAHGHHFLVYKMIENIKCIFSEQSPFVIAGNVGTPTACKDLASWGADAVKVGLSMGKACTTYNTTGVGTPMFSTVLECAEQSPIPIIADGQIRETGDICKALVAGADFVMIGSGFAECSNSPAERIVKTFGTFKRYYGSASEENGAKANYIEGTSMDLEMKPYGYNGYYTKIREAIQSCISYSGHSDIRHLNRMKYRIR